MWGPLKHWGLKWDPGSKKTSKINFTFGVPIRYQVLNGEDLTNVGYLIAYFKAWKIANKPFNLGK